MCSYCSLSKQQKEIITLKDTIRILSNKISELEAEHKQDTSETQQPMQTDLKSRVTELENKMYKSSYPLVLPVRKLQMLSVSPATKLLLTQNKYYPQELLLVNVNLIL